MSLSYKYESEQKLTSTPTWRRSARSPDSWTWATRSACRSFPVYDTGSDAAELIAENAAIYGCERVLIGSSRKGVLYHLVKGNFQQRLEELLPEDMPVEVIVPDDVPVREEETVAAH